MPSKPDRVAHDTTTVTLFFGGMSGVGLSLAVVYTLSLSPAHVASLALWAIGLWVAGLGIGFLFGIPRVLQDPAATPPPLTAGTVGGAAAQAPTPPRGVLYGQRVNTNLEEISDWLTKIIIGVGLVELKQLPGKIGELGRVVVRGLPADQSAFGIAVVLFFCVIGFLFGYLLTRLYVQAALARAESGLASELADLALKADKTEAAVQVLQAGQGPEASPPGAKGLVEGDAHKALAALVDEYKRADNIANKPERTAVRNELAARMGALVVSQKTPRQWLAQQPDEVYGLALAMASVGLPENDDAELLLGMAARIARLHIRYKVVLALSSLHDKGMLRDREKAALDVLTQFESKADEPLMRRLESVRRQITG
jgi:hypothetical protein